MSSRKRKDGVIVFNVYYSERGRKTPINDISRDLKIDEGILDKAFRIFEKQNEVDYFINKNAKEFLREQFNLWMYLSRFLRVKVYGQTKELNSFKYCKILHLKL